MTRAPARRRARLLAAGLSLALLPAGQALAAGSPRHGTGTRAPSRAPARHTVTLITGDTVTVTEPGGGREAVAVDRREAPPAPCAARIVDGRVTVVPDEARPCLDAGVLDQHLFGVTGLVAQGVDGDLPLTATYARGARAAAPRGGDATRALPGVGAGGTGRAGRVRRSGAVPGRSAPGEKAVGWAGAVRVQQGGGSPAGRLARRRVSTDHMWVQPGHCRWTTAPLLEIR